jgi:hypothetical protein
MILFMRRVTAIRKALIRAVVGLLTWTLVGAAVGLVGAAVFGFLCGVVYGLIHGQLAAVFAVMLHTAPAGAAAGAITGAAGKLFNGDLWPPTDDRGEGNIPERDAGQRDSKRMNGMAVRVHSPHRAWGEY